MTTITNGLKVIAHHGSCDCGHMFISETFLHGEVVKVNAKSIRATFTEEVRTTNGKEISRRQINETATFRFPLPNDLPYTDAENPSIKHYFCCCGDCDLYRQDITRRGISRCQHFAEL